MSNIGNQVPRIFHKTDYSYTSGEDACELSAAYGMKADFWQENTVCAWLAEYKNTKLIHSRCGIAVPRQNGKNGILEIVELFKIAVQGRKVLHTAHEVKTARKAFLRLASFFENERKYPELASMVKEIRRTNGQEAILLDNGGSVEFVARSRGSGRGFTVDDLVMDEAQDLTDEQLEALLPTISSAPSGDPQQIYLGTPPGPRSPGTVFARVRNVGVSGKDRRLAWVEFSIADDVTSREVESKWREFAYETNPALGVRLNIGTVQDEFRTMSPDGFARERLGQWTSEADSRAISDDAWEAICVEPIDTPEDGRTTFGVKFSADGAQVGLAGGLRPKNGAIHVEAVRWESMREGTGWLVDFLVARKDKIAAVAIDGKYGVGMLVNELVEAGFPKKGILTPRVNEAISAHSMFEQAIGANTVTTIKQDEVVKQVGSAVKRPIGKDGGFGWSTPDENGSVVLLDALTLAFWAAKTTKRRPGRKAVAL
ncbi:ATP-binding protein [Arcanobacterium phocae]|uniref:ATP-binding protein n=1 Tax=Arcanobacterium phocae TaxID=131112 RepID=UPI001C0ECD91|nr:ATP-binding protein [Arcanobacterium phocae]